MQIGKARRRLRANREGSAKATQLLNIAFPIFIHQMHALIEIANTAFEYRLVKISRHVLVQTGT